MHDAPLEHGRGGRMLLVGVALLVCVIAARCFVSISPDPWFDVDPLQNPLPWFGIGPVGVIVSSVLLLLGSSLVLLGERSAGRGIDRVLLFLALIPLVAIIYHGGQDADDLWRGVDWMAAVMAGVALAHAARDAGVRAILIGALVGVVALLALRGGLEVLVEHPATVAFYEQKRASVLSSFGWEPGSVQADLYERRLMQPEASGWFGLSNIFSGLMVLGTLVLLGSPIEKLARGSFLLLLLVALGFIALILVNGSKGAIAAGVLGCIVICAPRVFRPLRARWRTLPGALAMGCLAIAIIAVLVRAFLEESFLGGERSLLFRGHYIEASWAMVGMHPLFGVGPAGFQDAYLFFKPPLSPEDPTSAHNMLVDWVATLGVFGTAWIALLTMLVLRCGRVAEDFEDAPAAGSSIPGSLLVAAALVIAGVFGIVLEIPALTEIALVLRVVGILLAVTVAFTVRDAILNSERWKLPWSIGGVLGALLALGAIDMLFIQPGSVAIAWAFVGVFSAARAPRQYRLDALVGLVPILLAVWVVLAVLVPAWSVNGKMEAAARPLRALGALPDMVEPAPAGLNRWTRMEALDGVQRAFDAAFPSGPDALPLRRAFDGIDLGQLAPESNDPRVIVGELVRRLAPDARREAIAELLAAIEADQGNRVPVWASIEQLRLLAATEQPAEASVTLLEALVRLDDLNIVDPSARGAIVSAWVMLESALAEQNPDWDAVIAAFSEALVLSPHDTLLWIGLADVAHATGDVVLERDALERALVTDDQRMLDPLVQLSLPRREELEQRLAGVSAQSSE